MRGDARTRYREMTARSLTWIKPHGRRKPTGAAHFFPAEAADVVDERPPFLLGNALPARHGLAPLGDLPEELAIRLGLDGLVGERLGPGFHGGGGLAVTLARFAVTNRAVLLEQRPPQLEAGRLIQGILGRLDGRRRLPLRRSREDHRAHIATANTTSAVLISRPSPSMPQPASAPRGAVGAVTGFPVQVHSLAAAPPFAVFVRLDTRRATRRPTRTPCRSALASMVARRTTAFPFAATVAVLALRVLDAILEIGQARLRGVGGPLHAGQGRPTQLLGRLDLPLDLRQQTREPGPGVLAGARSLGAQDEELPLQSQEMPFILPHHPRELMPQLPDLRCRHGCLPCARPRPPDAARSSERDRVRSTAQAALRRSLCEYPRAPGACQADFAVSPRPTGRRRHRPSRRRAGMP